MERRKLLTAVGTGAVGLFAGCLNAGDTGASEDDSTDTATEEPQNPWGKDTVVVAYEQEVNARHGFSDLVSEGLEYWEQNSETYTDHTIAYQLKANEDDPDILIRLVDEIPNCGEVDHDDETVGCAPLITDRAPDTSEVEIVDGYEDEPTVETIKHELGHTLGLDHDDEPQEFMSNDIEDRVPGYDEKIEILELYGDGINDRNEGVDYWGVGVDGWNDESYDRAAAEFENAVRKYEEGLTRFEKAVSITENIGATEATKICEEVVEFVGLERNAASLMKRASEEVEAGNYDEAERYHEDSQDALDDLDELEIRDGEALADALGLPGEKY
ncbi:zinc metalloprotease [Halorussus amylolyticus]|uniref:hypothetical protein n=1 Tax=Halorussus amylolyticus TaxID=1126242 RepID=UPI001043AC33|nr:hypothetical protein [Halorussus amylolyticus]